MVNMVNFRFCAFATMKQVNKNAMDSAFDVKQMLPKGQEFDRKTKHLWRLFL